MDKFDNYNIGRILGSLSLVSILLGIATALFGGPLIGLDSFSLQISAAVLAVLSFTFAIIPIIPPPPVPPRPRCPPYCEPLHIVAICTFILAAVAELFLPGAIAGITATELLLMTVSLSVLHATGSFLKTHDN